MTTLSCMVRALSLTNGSRLVNEYFAWGDIFQRWLLNNIISPSDIEKGEVCIYLKKRPFLRTFRIEKFDVNQFEQVKDDPATAGCFIGGRGNSLTPYMAGFFIPRLEDPEAGFPAGVLSIGLPDPEIGVIHPIVAEDLWRTAVDWTSELDVLRLVAGSPTCLGAFGGNEDAFLPIVSGYQWMLYLRPDIVDLLGGSTRVLQDAPVERAQLVDKGQNRGVLCRIAPSPDSVSDAQWIEWREFLLPVLGERMFGLNPGHAYPRLTPEDRAYFGDGIHLFERRHDEHDERTFISSIKITSPQNLKESITTHSTFDRDENGAGYFADKSDDLLEFLGELSDAELEQAIDPDARLVLENQKETLRTVLQSIATTQDSSQMRDALLDTDLDLESPAVELIATILSRPKKNPNH